MHPAVSEVLSTLIIVFLILSFSALKENPHILIILFCYLAEIVWNVCSLLLYIIRLLVMAGWGAAGVWASADLFFMAPCIYVCSWSRWAAGHVCSMCASWRVCVVVWGACLTASPSVSTLWTKNEQFVSPHHFTNEISAVRRGINIIRKARVGH